MRLGEFGNGKDGGWRLAFRDGWSMVRAMERVVEPEILDGLPPDDPAARASRRDLKWINLLMGNERWILKKLDGHSEAAARGVVEWGAGEALLLRRLAEYGPATGMDLVPRPDGLDAAIGWEAGNLLERASSGGVLVVNLFLHHFEGDELRELGAKMDGFEVVIGVEPLRSRSALALGGLIMPFVSRVTRHDMPASIRAGFRPGELQRGLSLDSGIWGISESCSMLGGLRWMASRE